MCTTYFYDVQDNRNNTMFTLNCKGRLLLVKNPIVMGIINTTPDSFFGESRHTLICDALKMAEKMLEEGATILDIGGQSTRPGSDAITQEEEINRVIPIINAINKLFPKTYISIDTYYATVAKAAVEAGASIVNDISSGTIDDAMIKTVATLNVPYICMHIKGTPKTMQLNPTYNHVMSEVLDFFITKIDECTKAGINDIIIDLGFGFGKLVEHNYEMLKNLESFKMLNKPILVGVSRKGMIYKPLNTTAEFALNGTTVLNTTALQKGANILRVHDVKEAVEAIKLLELLN